MTLDALIMLAGVLTSLIAISGFPSEWKMAMLFVVGVFVVALGIVVRRRGLGSKKMPRQMGAPQVSDEHGRA